MTRTYLDLVSATPGAKSLGVVLPGDCNIGGISMAGAAETGIHGKAIVRGDGMNGVERAFSRHLETRKLAGDVLRWDFQPETFRLADDTRYTPDFRVILPDMTVVFYEVKGRKKDGYWIEEDAWIKFKVAVDRHPYRFIIVWPLKGGGWGERET